MAETRADLESRRCRLYSDEHNHLPFIYLSPRQDTGAAQLLRAPLMVTMMSEFAADSAEFQRARLDLRDVLSEAYATARNACEHGHQLVLTLAPDPVWIIGDFSRLREATENLLESACRRTRPRGRIRLSLKHADGSAVIQVSHGGIGLTRAEEKRRLGGVRRCVKLHGGTLEAGRSNARKGQQSRTELTLRLPLAIGQGPSS